MLQCSEHTWGTTHGLGEETVSAGAWGRSWHHPEEDHWRVHTFSHNKLDGHAQIPTWTSARAASTVAVPPSCKAAPRSFTRTYSGRTLLVHPVRPQWEEWTVSFTVHPEPVQHLHIALYFVTWGQLGSDTHTHTHTHTLTFVQANRLTHKITTLSSSECQPSVSSSN